jgi:hypothetical protein
MDGEGHRWSGIFKILWNENGILESVQFTPVHEFMSICVISD